MGKLCLVPRKLAEKFKFMAVQFLHLNRDNLPYQKVLSKSESYIRIRTTWEKNLPLMPNMTKRGRQNNGPPNISTS